MHKNGVCFKISADAGMAHDGKGNNSPVSKISEKEYDDNH